jgi:nucleoid-associated protein YgaU
MLARWPVKGEGAMLRGVLFGLSIVALSTAAAFVLVPRGDDAEHASLSGRPVATPLAHSPAISHGPVQPAPPAFDVVTIAPDGMAVLAGRAAPGSLVQVFDGDEKLGEVVADRRGEWVLIPARPLAAGTHRLGLRVATRPGLTIASAAAVVATLPRAAPAAAGPPKAAASAARAYRVRRGNTLWQIARHFLGAGIRYLAIYAANLDRIRDPDLIYPGQVFRLPRS